MGFQRLQGQLSNQPIDITKPLRPTRPTAPVPIAFFKQTRSTFLYLSNSGSDRQSQSAGSPSCSLIVADWLRSAVRAKLPPRFTTQHSKNYQSSIETGPLGAHPFMYTVTKYSRSSEQLKPRSHSASLESRRGIDTDDNMKTVHTSCGALLPVHCARWPANRGETLFLTSSYFSTSLW